MRKYISGSLIEQKHINNLVFENSERIKLLEEFFKRLEVKKNEIFYKG